jgi:type IVB pilus formation R64 PilN family outer membrane protein
MRFNRVLRFAIAGLAPALLLGLGGCSTMQEIHAQANRSYAQARSAARSALAKTAPAAPAVAVIKHAPYVNTTALSYHATSGLLDRRASIAMGRVPASSLSSLLATVTGLDVHLARSALYSKSQPAVQAAPQGPMDSTLKAPPPPAEGSPVYTTVYAGPVIYHGTVRGVLDAVASSMGATWSYDPVRDRVVMYRDETRIFHISMPPVAGATMKIPYGSGGGQNIQGGTAQILRVNSSGPQIVYTSQTSVWNDTQAAVKSMLSSHGTMVASLSATSIMVHDHWQNVKRIAKYIDNLNRGLSEEVSVNIKVYEVKLSNEDNRGISWNALYNAFQQSADEPGLAFGMTRPVISQGSSLILSAPQANENGTANWFQGSKFFIDALSTLGKVSVVDDETQVTVNNTPVAFKTFNLNSYLAQTTPSLYSGIGGVNQAAAAAGLTPGDVETGLDISLLPSVQPDGKRIVIQMSLSDTTLDSIQTANSGGEQIELPNVSGRQSTSQTWLRSGDSFVVAGYQSAQSSNTTQTPFTKTTWLAGGSRDITAARDMIVVVVTPVARAYDSTLH